MHKKTLLPAALCLLCACGQSPRDQALTDVKGYVQSNLDDLAAASAALQAAAPNTAWADRAPIDAMRAEWRKARTAYENVEGAIAVLFPELDASTDERYDGFLANGPDDDLFDDQGVTGVHAIERILWSDSIPERVKTFEKAIPGYQPARFPATAAEAQSFRDKLCARLVRDINTMRDQFRPLALDPAAAFRGVIGSIGEQVEKADKAATGEEESRYAQYTLADMRANVAGGVRTAAAFRPWLESIGAADTDAKIQAGFARLSAAYGALPGDALPPVPATWSSANPTAADQATPFGTLYKVLKDEADPARDGSLSQAMDRAAAQLGIPQL